MVTLNAASLTNLVNDTSLTAARAEDIIDMAIDCLVLYGQGALSLPNLSGTAGTKTANVTNGERGAILLVANQIYLSMWKSGGSMASGSLGGLSYSESESSIITSNLMNNPQVLAAVQDAAWRLIDVEVSRA